jgi:6-phosphogluconate dehydrogenase
MNTSCNIGMIGLGAMGRNLAVNMADRGFVMACYDRHLDKVALLAMEAGGRRDADILTATESPQKITIIAAGG